MKVAVVIAVICLVLSISETKAAIKFGLRNSLELPILGEINTNVNAGADVHKGLLGLTKNVVKGLMAKATSAFVKPKPPKDTNPIEGVLTGLLKLG